MIPGWGAGLLALALIAAAVIARRRRAPAIDVPEAIPDDLIERERAGV